MFLLGTYFILLGIPVTASCPPASETTVNDEVTLIRCGSISGGVEQITVSAKGTVIHRYNHKVIRKAALSQGKIRTLFHQIKALHPEKLHDYNQAYPGADITTETLKIHIGNLIREVHKPTPISDPQWSKIIRILESLP